MAELTTLARPYAKAAFEFAQAKGSLAEWSSMLALLAAVIKQDKLEKVLSSPSLTSAQQADILIDVCGDKVNTVIGAFIKTLAENKRLSLLAEIHLLFDELKAAVERTVDVQVTSAFALNNEAEENLAKALAKKLNCDVKVASTVDTSLIGGVIIRAGDMIIDGSIRGRLTKLAEAMNS